MTYIPFFNLYPMQQEPYSQSRLNQNKVAASMGFPVKPLPPLVTVNNPEEHVKHALSNFSTTIVTSLTEKKLKHCKEYKDAYTLMPNLSDVKNITKYRKQHPKYDQQGVNYELDKYGMNLPAGMVLFHGGVFPRLSINGGIGTDFFTDRPLSTTFCAQVAAVHSEYHSPKEIWIIRISKNSTTKAFIFNNAIGQTHGHETEVLLSSGARVTYLSSFNINNHTIYNVEVC